MIREVGAFEAKTRLSQLLDEVEQGHTIVITRHGRRVAELVPARPKRKAKFGSAKGAGFFMAADFDAPLEQFKDYMCSSSRMSPAPAILSRFTATPSTGSKSCRRAGAACG